MTEREQLLLNAGAAKDFWHTMDVPELDLPSLNMNDGPHGVRGTQSSDIIVTDNAVATCFPTSSALAATWNPKLVAKIGNAIGREARDHGINVLLGPGINLKRTPLGGRNFEYYSEDGYLTSQIASAFVKGVQENGVAACLKHYILNEQEIERMTINCIVDQRTLFETYIRPFKDVIEQASPMMIMSSYNRVNGEKVTESKYLINDILRNQLGFKGTIVSDWGAVIHPVEALQAGVDFDMPFMGKYQTEEIRKAIEENLLDLRLLEERFERIRVMTKRMEFDIPSHPSDYNEHYWLAYLAACESMVLLKNDEHILPINSKTTEKIGIIGSYFKEPRIQGAGSSKVSPFKMVTPEKGLIMNYPNVNYEWLDTSQLDLLNIENVEKIQIFAKKYSKLVLFTGLDEMDESEGIDRKTMALSLKENRLINLILATNDQTIICLNNGTSVSFDFMDKCKTILEMWLGGEALGEAVWDIIFGMINPSGKLSETFPLGDNALPQGTSMKMNEEDILYSEGVLVGYKYYDFMNRDVHFPFGHGLSYTTFKLMDINVIEDTEGLKIELSIENTGDRVGEEVVQVYRGRIDQSTISPKKELISFVKLALEPQEKQTLTIETPWTEFTRYNVKTKMYQVEQGKYKIMVGTSSRDISFETEVYISNNNNSSKQQLMYLDDSSICKEFYKCPEVRELFVDYFSYLKETGLFDIIMDMPLNLVCRLFPDLVSSNKVNGFLREFSEIRNDII